MGVFVELLSRRFGASQELRLFVATGLLGVLINLGARALERRLLSWHTSVRGEVAA